MSDSKITELKCENPWFSEVYEGKKNFEVRTDDRGGFVEGQIIKLLEYDRHCNSYSGRYVLVRIRYVLKDGRFTRENQCIFGFDVVSKSSENIPVTIYITPDVMTFLANMASVNHCSVADVVERIVEERVEGTMRI